MNKNKYKIHPTQWIAFSLIILLYIFSNNIAWFIVHLSPDDSDLASSKLAWQQEQNKEIEQGSSILKVMSIFLLVIFLIVNVNEIIDFININEQSCS